MTRRQATVGVLAALALGAAQAARADAAPGEFQIPGTQTMLKLYGYVQLDTTIDFSGRPVGYENSDWATILPAVPSDNSPEGKHVKPQTYLTARTSRIGLQSRTPTPMGDLGIRLEADFNAPNDFQSETYTNSVMFRLRHAYATMGGFLVGQTWSTFFDLNAAPDTVDYNGPGTQALVRNPMFKYTYKFNDQMNLAVALENNRGPQFGVDSRFQTIPDLHANFGWSPKWGTLSARVVLQFYNRAALTGPAANPAYGDASAKTATGVGVAVSGSTKFGEDTLVGQFVGGPGIGRYMLNTAALGNAGPGVTVDAAGNVKLWSVWGLHAGYTHVWNPKFRSNLVAAYTWVEDAKIDGLAATNAVQKEFYQAFVNTFYSMTKQASIGVEYAYGRWNSFGSPQDHGTQNRINALFHYDFY
jgi:hypothetical protein